jgi:3-hydroxyisobutyrate dehydrogenase-like beta-hydroxyacid dehydrogenase
MLVDLPHVPHASAAQLAAASDIIALCLRDDQDIWDILLDQGLTAALRPGAIVVNHGTGDPQENVRIGAHLRSHGHGYLDAPVSGGRPGAMARTLTTIVGGDTATFERCRPVFETFSTKIAHMGGVGSGQLAKLLNNALTFTNLRNAVAVLNLAGQASLDVATLHDVVSVSSGSSTILKMLGEMKPETAAHLQGLMRKDIEHFADAVRARNLDPADIHAWGLGGIEGLVDTVAALSKETPDSITAGA